MIELNIRHEPPRQPRLRAVVEIVGGELKVFPIADTDEQAAEIMDALRFIREDFGG